jgi:putative ABC transport system permease protein
VPAYLVILTAFRALRRNRLRSLLTMLGILIGIAAVICTVALGEGSAAQIHNDLLNLGDNFVWIENGSRTVSGARTGAGSVPRLTGDDLDAIVNEVPEISRCSAQVDSRAQVQVPGRNWNTTYRGVSADYLRIRRWTVVAGDAFTDTDVQHAAAWRLRADGGGPPVR